MGHNTYTTMKEIITFVTENWDSILAALGAVYAAATAIALVTPSDKDNTVLQKIGKIADRIGLKLKGK